MDSGGERTGIRVVSTIPDEYAVECIQSPLRVSVTLSSGNVLYFIDDLAINTLMQVVSNNNIATKFLTLRSEDGVWHHININHVEDVVFIECEDDKELNE